MDFTHTHHKITGFSQTLNSGYVDVSRPSSGLFRASHTEIPQCIVQPGDQKAICHWSRRRMRWCQRMEPIFQRHGCGLSQKGWPRSENFGISGISERNSTLGLKMDHRTWSSIFRQLQLCLFNDHFVILSFPGRTLLLRGIFFGKNLYKIESSISLHPYTSLHHIASIFVCNVETK